MFTAVAVGRNVPIADRCCGVGRIDERLEVVASGSALLGGEDEMFGLPVRKMTGPHIEHVINPVIQRDRPARAGLSFRVTHRETAAFEVNLLPSN